MTEDELFCSECIHRSMFGRNVGCLYLGDTGQPRGCPPGRNCNKRVVGPIVNRTKIYSVIDPAVRKKRKEADRERNEMIAYKGEALKRMRIKE